MMTPLESRELVFLPPELVRTLVGSRCSVSGTVMAVRNNNPFTKSQKPHRQFMLMLKPARVSTFSMDHLWVPGFKKLWGVGLGDDVSFEAKVSIYNDKGVLKVGLTTACCIKRVKKSQFS